MDGDSNSIGDGHCNDENNNAACQFDHGDCGPTTTPTPLTGTVYNFFKEKSMAK